MKKIRYLPFGYRIANGNYEVVPEEGQLVRQIFSQYLEGSSLLQLAEMAQRSGIPYRENTAHWNKNMIARMLDDTRYWQDQCLPLLVDEETAAAVTQLRREKSTPPCPIQAVRAKLVCCDCGGALLRVSKNAPRIRWDCKTCGRRFGPVTDRELLTAIQVRLEALCQNPSLAEVPHLQQPALSLEAVRLTHEIQRAFMERGVDTTQVLDLIHQCAAEKYKTCAPGGSDHITIHLKRLLEQHPAREDLLERAVRKIILQPECDVRLQLVNEKVF